MKPLRFKGIGHIILFVVVGALLLANAYLLYGAQSKVSKEKKAAEEAAKPAELELTILAAPACKECFDISMLIGPLKGNEKIKVTSEKTIEYTSDEGAGLVSKYGITHVPTVLVSGQTEKAFDVASFLQNIGKKHDDGTLVVTNVPAPYIDVATGAVKGAFTVTYLTDKGCAECYDPQLHERALAGLAMTPSEMKFVDRADAQGRTLISRYNIESTPTILLEGDLSAYPQFAQVWSSVGTVEKDGTHVFRAGQKLMGAYHDLVTGKVVKPEVPAAAPAAPVQPHQ